MSTTKILGDIISNKVSVSDHITNITRNCSQTVYALTIFWTHGLCHTILKSVYRSVVAARPIMPGGVSRAQLTDNDLQASYVVAFDEDFVHLI